jgi:hypothetical protein
LAAVPEDAAAFDCPDGLPLAGAAVDGGSPGASWPAPETTPLRSPFSAA